ncbi:hypothetical protein Cni_G28592 [Canna indica]|uniref:Reverse transcriptase zinc-binding domain-containing protein n=1 Tax=Canna indica TaxID=4628 RepID=A0AAQ3L459_9LILI|nr:hypothetical protein Cni_G28592 [Canna indica]
MVHAHQPLVIVPINHDDKFIWNLGSGGSYSVASGYEIAFRFYHPPVTKGPPYKRLWNSIWDIKVSPKIKILIWKLLHEGVPNSPISGTQQYQVFSKLKLVRQGILSWLKNNSLQQQQLHALTPANTLDYSVRKRILEDKLLQALKDEEIYWRQKSKIKWLREGDRNTGYFRACTKARRNYNSIPRIKNSENEWVEGVDQVAQVAISHFNSKFGSSNPTDINRYLQGIQKKVSRRADNWLIRPVTYEEIKKIKKGSL